MHQLTHLALSQPMHPHPLFVYTHQWLQCHCASSAGLTQGLHLLGMHIMRLEVGGDDVSMCDGRGRVVRVDDAAHADAAVVHMWEDLSLKGVDSMGMVGRSRRGHRGKGQVNSAGHAHIAVTA